MIYKYKEKVEVERVIDKENARKITMQFLNDAFNFPDGHNFVVIDDTLHFSRDCHSTHCFTTNHQIKLTEEQKHVFFVLQRLRELRWD